MAAEGEIWATECVVDAAVSHRHHAPSAYSSLKRGNFFKKSPPDKTGEGF